MRKNVACLFKNLKPTLKATPNTFFDDKVGSSCSSRRSFRCRLGPPVVPFCPFSGEGSPTIIDVLKKVGPLIQGSLKDTFCPFETWLFPPKYRETTIYKAM